MEGNYSAVHVHDADRRALTGRSTYVVANWWGYHVVHLYLAISSSFAACVLKS